MKEIHVGDSVRVGTLSGEVRGTVVDIDRRQGYGRLIVDCDELAIEGTAPKILLRGDAPVSIVTNLAKIQAEGRLEKIQREAESA